MKHFSTAQVAEMAGVHKFTLLQWLRAGKVREPKRVNQGGVEVRLWSNRDVQRVRKYKQENYRKGRGRKPKPGR